MRHRTMGTPMVEYCSLESPWPALGLSPGRIGVVFVSIAHSYDGIGSPCSRTKDSRSQ